ncbi:MAG TPA: D-cysteine desulfhydrase family protein [Anaerolineales bacterium]|nr:D-cysteine desulfhydrase family protein [Anaerolineales bacterium]
MTKEAAIERPPEHNPLVMNASLWANLDSYPRLPLAEYPTPLEYLPNLSRELGRDIFIKRDDEIGPGLGGNKTRKLEYLLAEAKRRGAKKVVTFGGRQSNHARITAAAALRSGLEPHLFYFERRPHELAGNLLLNQLMGARLHFIPFGGGGDASMTLETTNRLVHLVARLRLGSHYFIPVGGHSWLGCLGYVRAALEIDEQVKALGIPAPWLVVAAGSGGTLAGLLAGLAMLNSSIQLLGIDVGKLWKAFPVSIGKLAGEICHRLGGDQTFTPDEVPLIEERYVGRCYGEPSRKCLEALRRLATLEGILLDPVYTAKAFSGLLDLVEQGGLGDKEPVIFLHTGGLAALFAFQETIILD